MEAPRLDARLGGRHLCHRFLLDRGTQLLHPDCLTPLELCEAYSESRLRLIEGKKQPTEGQPRDISCYRLRVFDNPLRGHPYFINPHHIDVFEELFPQFADKIRHAEEEPGNGAVGVMPEDRVRRMCAQAPLTAQALRWTNLLRLCAEQEDQLGPLAPACRIEVMPSNDELLAVCMGLEDALRGVTATTGRGAGQVWTAKEWKRASRVTFGSRKEQVARIDALLPVYHRLAANNTPAALRVLMHIARLTTDHLLRKPTNDRRAAMADLGRQVLARL